MNLQTSFSYFNAIKYLVPKFIFINVDKSIKPFIKHIFYLKVYKKYDKIINNIKYKKQTMSVVKQ